MQNTLAFLVIASLSVSPILGFRVRSNARSSAFRRGPKVLAVCTSLGDGDVNPLLPVAAAFAADGWQVHFFASDKFETKLANLDKKVKQSTPDALPIQFETLFKSEFKSPDCAVWPDEAHPFNGMWNCGLLGAAAFLESGLEDRITKLSPDAIISASDSTYGKLMGRKLQVPSFMIIPWALGTKTQIQALGFMTPPGKPGGEYVNELRQGSKHMEEGIAKLKSMGLWRDDLDSEISMYSDPPYPSFLLTTEEATLPTAVAWIKEVNSTGEKFIFTGPTADPSLVTMSAANDTLIRQVEAAKEAGQKVVFFSFGTTFPIIPANLKEMYKHMAQMDSVLFVIAHVTQESLPMSVDDVDRPDNVITMQRVPQIPLLKLVDAFITHGGQNSVMEALVQSVPLVVVPWQVDQPRNAWHITSYGAGRSIPTPHVVRVQAQDYLCAKHGMSEAEWDKKINEKIRAQWKNDPTEGAWYSSFEDEVKEKGDFYAYKTEFLQKAIEEMYEDYGETAPEMIMFDDAVEVNKHIFAGLTEILENGDAFRAKAAKIGASLMQTMKDVGSKGIVAKVNGFVAPAASEPPLIDSQDEVPVIAVETEPVAKPQLSAIKQRTFEYELKNALAVRSQTTCEALKKVFKKCDYKKNDQVYIQQVDEMLDRIGDAKMESIDLLKEIAKKAKKDPETEPLTFKDWTLFKLDRKAGADCALEY